MQKVHLSWESKILEPKLSGYRSQEIAPESNRITNNPHPSKCKYLHHSLPQLTTHQLQFLFFQGCGGMGEWPAAAADNEQAATAGDASAAAFCRSTAAAVLARGGGPMLDPAATGAAAAADVLARGDSLCCCCTD